MAPRKTPNPNPSPAPSPRPGPPSSPKPSPAPRSNPSPGPAPTAGQWVAGGGGQIYGSGPSNRPSGGGGRTVGSVAGNRVLNKTPEETATFLANRGGMGATAAAASTDSGGSSMAEYDPYAAMEARDQMNLIATLSSIFKDYGLESLTSKIIDYVREGYNGDAIAVLLRETPEYKARFPAMATLAKKGRALSEAAYIDYERTAAQLERQYGLPRGMVSGNVTGLLENDISASELNDRITMAAAASIQAPQELKDTFQKYYNIGTGGLTAYWLDPNMAQPLLEKQFQTALIGAEAVRQGLDVDVYNAQNLQSLGISTDQARQGFGEVARDMSFTGGAGETIGQSDLIAGAFGNQAASQQTERVRASRQGRFQAGGGYAAESKGISGLATSSV